MTLPLYEGAADVAPLANGHAGLWYDKFCGLWRVAGNDWTLSAGEDDGPKAEWVNGIAKLGAVGDKGQVEEHAGRVLQLVHARAGRWLVFRTESTFVTGLGRSHPVENGFAWHPTLGTAYLPGSSVKGLVRSWAEEQADPRPEKAVAARILGSPERVGAVCFLDALPTAPVKLRADVMTPHFAGWDAQSPPGDWCAPVPIPFLATAAGTRLLFGLVPARGCEKGDLEQVAGWLQDALEWLGAGAKTAVGYGRMARDEDAENALREAVHRKAEEAEARRRAEAREANLDPLDRELLEIEENAGDLARYLAWLKAVEAGRWREHPETEAEVLRRIREEMGKTGKWSPTSEKKRPEKDKDHQRTLLVLRLLEQAEGR